MDRAEVAVLTGGTGAIGSAIARGLIAGGYRLVLVVRDRNRGEQFVRSLGGRSEAVTVEVCDLGRHDEISRLTTRLPSTIDVLVNNAAECPRRRQETPEGIERQWATNVLGYHWMIEHLSPALARAEAPRIVNVASYWAGDLDLSDVEFRSRRYDNDTAYRQSKQADRMLTVAHAERLAPQGIAVVACHPGDVRSKLSTDLGFGGHESPEQGADTPLWLATSRLGLDASGHYFARRKPETCRFGQNRREVEALMKLCESYAAR